MKKTYTDVIEEKIASLRTYDLAQQRAQLVAYKHRISATIDQRLIQLRDGRDLIQEALKRRMDLQKYRVGFFHFFTRVKFRHMISAPFIYSMLIPMVFLHIFLELYHQVCFRLYRIPRVALRDHLVFDRGYLAYLNWFEKINCIYCSYFNGMVSYTREIAGRTERYWCPIKHATQRQQEHDHQQYFVEYLDAKTYRKNLSKIRCFHRD